MSYDDTLTLIVTPGIREKNPTRDNLPEPIHVQIETINYFYKLFTTRQYFYFKSISFNIIVLIKEN